jgi:hypothetical protein
MRFKVEIQLPTGIVTKVFFAEDLTELNEKVLKEFPKGKVIGIIGS